MAASLLRCLHFLADHAVFIFFILFAVFLILSSPHWLLNSIAKAEVDTTPKVPMLLCDKHGMYPASAAFEITAVADGRTDLPVKICPFCFDENQRIAEQMLKG